MNILEITTNIGCVNDCLCCPQSQLLSAYGKNRRQLAYDDYLRVLKKLPHSIEIGFCGFSEPLLNPECARMLLATRQARLKARLLTTLVGLKQKDVETLKGCNPHYIRFHLPDTVQFRFPDARWIGLHRLFMEAKIPADYEYLSLGPITGPMQDYLKSIGVTEWTKQELVSRAGLLEERPVLAGNIYCSYNRWHYNVMMPNGDVYLCCMDFGLKHRLGNILDQAYDEIYDAAERLRLGDHDSMICAKCEWAVPGKWHNPFGRPVH